MQIVLRWVLAQQTFDKDKKWNKSVLNPKPRTPLHVQRCSTSCGLSASSFGDGDCDSDAM